MEGREEANAMQRRAAAYTLRKQRVVRGVITGVPFSLLSLTMPRIVGAAPFKTAAA